MIKMINKLKNKKGFTLIELIVVLAVLAIIMAIAVPRFTGVKDKTKEDADIATLGLIAKTAEFYYAQGSVDLKFKTDTGAKIDGDLLTSLTKDFPTIDFQTNDGAETLGDVNLFFDANGKAKASYGSLSSK